MSDYDEYENIDANALYALTWDHAGLRFFWSYKYGWIQDVDKAFLLCLEDVEAITNETEINKLPSGKEVRSDAVWRPVGRRELRLDE